MTELASAAPHLFLIAAPQDVTCRPRCTERSGRRTITPTASELRGSRAATGPNWHALYDRPWRSAPSVAGRTPLAVIRSRPWPRAHA